MVAIIAAGYYFYDQIRPRTGFPIAPPVQKVQGDQPAAAPVEPAETSAAALLRSRPDPTSGLLAFAPEKPGDPSAFEMKITEVICAEYAPFLRETLNEGPAGWTGSRNPPNSDNLPVTGITQLEAKAYCTWLATKRGLPADGVRLPTRREFLRALRGRTTRGDPLEASYWQRARLYEHDELSTVKSTQFDKIFIADPEGKLFDRGQMYDLLDNAAEWGGESQGDDATVLGGDFQQKSPDFDPLKIRSAPAATRSPAIGFRFVVKPR